MARAMDKGCNAADRPSPRPRLHVRAGIVNRFLEPVYDLKWLTLGRNRDEWVANGAPHGLMPMQATWPPNR
ncbi:MAG: hypothetical protein LBV61_05250, partial [Burkholderiaceae bacterium]|nr:hypothetical protein [Burkholderiaceae bacterium]